MDGVPITIMSRRVLNENTVCIHYPGVSHHAWQLEGVTSISGYACNYGSINPGSPACVHVLQNQHCLLGEHVPG